MASLFVGLIGIMLFIAGAAEAEGEGGAMVCGGCGVLIFALILSMKAKYHRAHVPVT